jgi:hypothetical protein
MKSALTLAWPFALTVICPYAWLMPTVVTHAVTQQCHLLTKTSAARSLVQRAISNLMFVSLTDALLCPPRRASTPSTANAKRARTKDFNDDNSNEETKDNSAESTSTPSHTDNNASDDVEIVLNDKEMAAEIGVTKATTSFTILNAFGLDETHEIWRDKLELGTLKSIRTYQTLEFRTYNHDLYHYKAFTSIFNTKTGTLIVANSVYVYKVTGDTMIILLILK